MKCLIIEDGKLLNFYELPKEFNSVAEFVEYINKTLQVEYKLTNLNPINCVFPIFIKDDFFEENVIMSESMKFYEREVGVDSREGYDQLLKEIVKIKCVRCKHYEHHPKDDLESHRRNISLTGMCPYFEYNENWQDKSGGTKN